ncbi:hypothetical protein [Lentibacillus amyloliquefaciens]|uniref:Uncharacterized protein n=1 Tax=Lentibacillus amyloliquefaciens TaxID=1472767 RepID=A0A0U4FAJ1_9BACI|nr:hypothetical protein [Lentibacillus amyloliquefaciens]ALX47517.1 hypothetical protein AOX59_02205 [Lentibacillus amyloliquefaciens]
MKELIGGKISETAPDLNVEELKNKAGEFLNADGLSDQANELKDQASESVNAEGLTDQVNEAARPIHHVHIVEKGNGKRSLYHLNHFIRCLIFS